MSGEDVLKKYKPLLNSGEIYVSSDDELLDYQHILVERLHRINQTPDTPEGLWERENLLREACGTYGEGLYIVPPLYANWGLKNVHFGTNVVLNFNVQFVDDADIFIGSDTMIGPGCQLITAAHPVSPVLRRSKLQYNKPVRLGKNVWLGANVIVLPGVTIGDNSVIGAGSVVTHDIPDNVVAYGSPARVIRQITEDDDRFYDGGKPVDPDVIHKYVTMNLRLYDGQCVRITIKDGAVFEGVCTYDSEEYNEAETGIEGETLRVSGWSFRKDDIQKIELLKGPEEFSAPYGIIEETIVNDGTEYIVDALEWDDEPVGVYRLLCCLNAHSEELEDRDILLEALHTFLKHEEDEKLRAEAEKLVQALS